MDARIDLRSVVGLFQRQYRLMLAVFALLMTVAAAVVFSLAPIFTATTLVMVDPADKNLLLPQSQLAPTMAADARIEGEVVLARSDNVLLTVIDREKLVEDEEFRAELGLGARLLASLNLRQPTMPSGEQALQQTLGKLASMTNVERHRGTFLMSISVSSQDPDRAARLANTVAAAYIDTQVSAKVQSTLAARTVLLAEVNAARQRVVETDGAFDRFVDTNLGAMVEETGNPSLAAIQAEIDRLRSGRDAANAEITSLQAELAREDFTALAVRLADEAIRNLEQTRQSLMQRIGTEPQAEVDLRGELTRIETELAQAANRRVSTLQAQVEKSFGAEAAERGELRLAVLASGLSSDVLTQIYDLGQQAEFARQQYDQLLSRSQQLQAEATLQLADSRVVSPALRPGNSSGPQTWRLLAIVALGALVLGLALAYLYEQLIGGITSGEQLASVARTPLALGVPSARLPAGRNSVADLMTTAPLSAFAESIRRIRTSVDNRLAARSSVDPVKASVIVVSSTSPSEGKTTTSLALARSYALAGRKTLLVDCDLRRPALHDQLGLVPSRGLIDALESDDPAEDLKNMLARDEETDLLVLVGSRRSTGATDQLVTSRHFDKLMHAATHAFDVVVLDTPPLGPVVDGLYIAQKADAVIFVVQWAATSQRDVRNTLLSLEEALNRKDLVIPVLTRQEAASSRQARRYAPYYGEATS